MISRYVRSGDRIEMKRNLPQGSGSEGPLNCTSRVVSIIDDDSLNISEAWFKDSPVEILAGELLELRFVVAEGSYICKATVLEENIKNGVLTYTLRLITEPKKNQRRRFFRMEKMIPVRYILPEEAEYEYEGTVLNISAGGIKFSSTKQLTEGQNIKLGLYLNGDKAAREEITCRVIDSYKVNGRVIRFDNRVAFVNMNREQTEKIVKFVFEEERKRKHSEKDFY